MARVEIDNLVKKFDATLAVDHLSMNIEDGEFVAIVGPSGCGKSSTLRMIGGLEKPSGGRILFGEKDVTTLSADHRDVAMVFQSYALYPHMSVERNLAFPLENMRLPREEIARRVAKAAAMLEIESLLGRRPRQLSGGQRQRVALGRAIVRDAAVFLLDEPLSNLDARLRVTMRTELKQLHNELRQTFIYVTHDQAEAMTMADRIAVMSNGKLQQLGTPDDIYFRPANRFVAEFMGMPPMNFLRASIAREAGRGVLTIDGVERRWPLADQFEQVRPPSVAAGIRPEAIRLAESQEDSIPGRIVLIEPLHPDIFVTIDIGGQSLVLRTDTSLRLVPGQRVDLTIDARQIHLFGASGEILDYKISNESKISQNG